MIGPYETPHAFRMALEERLRNISLRQGIDLQRLRRRVGFERLLARLFADQVPPWFLKGGYALELRMAYRARSTRDLDLTVPDPGRLDLPTEAGLSQASAEKLHENLQLAAARDLGDGFRFVVRTPRGELAGAPGGGIRCAVEAHPAGRAFAQFHVDVGVGDPMVGEPEWVSGEPILAFAGIPEVRIPVVPAAQQFAEKIHAYTFPWQDRDNTRVKDLVDLVLLVHSGLLGTREVRQALEATFRARATHPLQAELPEPPEAWSEPYRALAAELGIPERDLRRAYECLTAFWKSQGLDQLGEG
ncbi:MAG TPA: nucleotidyl transferase AbiEii/AbiGii toxin family protein [Anaerolineae bacterium]|nr:nucleotidyl transferase AbiEii/AbiGii toxin family protein [Anaerolineae bacterium]